MPNLMIDLIVDRVDLVDEGANSQAFIKLYKRKETDLVMDLNEILAKMKPEHAEVIKTELAKAKKQADDAESKAEEAQEKLDGVTEDMEKAKKQLEDLQKRNTELETVAKGKNTPEPSFEEVLKGLDPSVQAVFKSLNAQKEAAEAVAKAAAEKAANDEAIAKAKELKSLPIDEAKLVDVVKGVSPEIFDILKSASAAIEESGLFSEIGKSKSNGAAPNTGDANESWGKIEKAAEKIAEEQKVTKQKAIELAIKQNPALYREYLNNGAN